MSSGERQANVTTHFNNFAVNDRWGDVYNPANPLSYSFLARRRKAVELLGDLNGKKLLDIGCGTGVLIEPLLRTHVQYEGLDAAPQMIAEAQRHLQDFGVEDRFSVRVGSALALPCPADFFDAIVGMGLPEYFDAPELVIREALRVAKPGGRLVFTIPQKYCLDDVLIRATAPLRRVARMLTGRAADIVERDKYTPSELRAMCVGLGCRAADERFYNMSPVPCPLSRFWPGAAHSAARFLEEGPRFAFLATGYILACEK